MPEEGKLLSSKRTAPDATRGEQLGKLLDHCTAAQAIAEAQGEKFLAYMLAMTIEAVRAVRPSR